MAMQALILAGGSGTRFWPASRRSRPKQLLPIAGDRSLLQITLDRLSPLIDPEAVWVCTTQRLAVDVQSTVSIAFNSRGGRHFRVDLSSE